MPTDVEKTTNHEVMKEKSMVAIVFATSFHLGPTSQSIVTYGIWAIGSVYLSSLNNASLEEILKVYEGACNIVRFNTDPNPLKKPVSVYVSSVSTCLSLRQVALTFHDLHDLGKERLACIK